jgi:Tol biopolymer transport system component
VKREADAEESVAEARRHAIARAVGLALVVAAAATVASWAAPVARRAQLLAYEAPDGIHLVGVHGRADRLLPGTEPGDQNPEWSPQGDRIVLWSDADGAGDVFVIDVSTGKRTRLTDGADEDVHTDWFPSWSPDGATIVFNSDRGSGDGRVIYAVATAGGPVRRVTRGWSPRLSPTGRLTFQLGGRLVTTDADGGDRRELPRRNGRFWAAAWRPDGHALAFVTNEPFTSAPDQTSGNPTYEIARMGADGNDYRRLTANQVRDGDPVISPDGRTIAFDSGRFGWSEVLLMDARGRHQHRLTHELDGDACCPSWRP